jgi:hypothetical protein
MCPECGGGNFDGYCMDCGYSDPDYEYHPTVDADEEPEFDYEDSPV